MLGGGSVSASRSDKAADWLAMARSAHQAALEIGHAHGRSAASRAYYAAFAACHALMAHLRPAVGWPGRGHFRHGDLPGELRWTLMNCLPRFSAFQADVYRVLLEGTYNVRRYADYKPEQPVTAMRVAESIESAAQLVRLAERVVR
jgi:uncharacterized protein (UPF0332 family)